jgi:ATP-dependent exoDNAse (exonuclease V) alpha subunit
MKVEERRTMKTHSLDEIFEKAIFKSSKELQSKMRTLNKEQKYAMLKMMNGDNCFITGDAGTGKSYVINLFAEWCDEGQRHLLKTAPTGKASANIGGVTAHSLFGLPIRTEEMIQPTTALSQKVEQNLKYADRIIIDECSMLRMDAFEKVMEEIQLANEKKRKRGKRPIQVVLVGDFGQLPPVITVDDRNILNEYYGKDIGNGYCFQSIMWNEMGFETISLKQIVRQSDKDFSEALTKCKYGDSSCIEFFNENFKPTPNKNAIWLFGKNNSAFDKNLECMNKLPTESYRFKTKFEGEFTAEDKVVDKSLYLKEGCRVLITMNDTSSRENPMRYFNGSMGTLISVDTIKSNSKNKDHKDYEDYEDYEDEDYEESEENMKDEKVLSILLDDTDEIVKIEKYVYKKQDYKPVTTVEKKIKPVLDENGKPVLNEHGIPKTEEIEVKQQTSKLTTIGKATQFPVKVGYAITVHKSQGMTLDKVNYKPEVFAEGQFYVAMSRCKNIHNLYCEGVVTSRVVRTSKEFLKFIQNPNEYSFFTDTEIQRYKNRKNGINEEQLLLDMTPVEPIFDEIPKKKSKGFSFKSFKK